MYQLKFYPALFRQSRLARLFLASLLLLLLLATPGFSATQLPLFFRPPLVTAIPAETNSANGSSRVPEMASMQNSSVAQPNLAQKIVRRPQDYPPGLYPAYLQARQKEGGAEYLVYPSVDSGEGISLQAINPASQFTANFGKTGTTIGGMNFKLTRIGYVSQQGSALELASEIVPNGEGNRVSYQRNANLTEWFVNGPLGLEHGYTLHQPLPGSVASNQLELELSLGGVQNAELADSREQLKLVLAGGQTLNYEDLYVYDASGKVYPAHFWLTPISSSLNSATTTGREYRLGIIVSGIDEAVSYPLTIDPTFSQANQLLHPGAAGGDYFGTSVALSGDGSTAIIGAYGKTVGNKNQQGMVYIFTRIGAGANYFVSQQFMASDGAAGDYFGFSVALSGDGNTALVGSSNKRIGTNFSQGAAYILTRNESGIYSQAQQLLATDGAAGDYFGYSLALSDDSNTVIIGAYGKRIGNNTQQGAAYIFTRSGAGANYSQFQQLTASDGLASDYFGRAVALSDDNNTTLVGANNKSIGGNSQQGAAYIFTRNGVGANYVQTQRLTADNGTAFDALGNSVALSGNGNTALIGASDKTVGGNSQQGVAYIFTRSGAGASYSQAQLLAANDGASSDYFGRSVVLSSDGNTALIGAYFKKIGDNSQQGAAYIFTRSGAGASYSQTQQLTANDGASSDYFGNAVALSGVGTTALIGANNKTISGHNQQGAVYVFQIPPTITLTSNASVLNYGETIVVTATAAFPDGLPLENTMSTYVDELEVDMQYVPASGVITYGISGLAVGSHAFYARYNGGSYPSTNSPTITVVVTPAPTTLTVGSSPNPSLADQEVTFSATVTPPHAGGLVTFTIGSANVSALLSGGVATYITTSLAVGSYPVSASYAGDFNHTASTTTGQYSHEVTLPCNLLVVTAIGDDGTATTCGTFSFALATATAGQTISFSLTSGNILTFTGSLTPAVGVGVTIDGGQAGIILNGNGVGGNGLRLSSGNTLTNLTIKNFAGQELVVTANSAANHIFKVRVQS